MIGRHARSEPVVDGGGHRNGIAFGVNHGIVRRMIRLRRRGGGRMGGSIAFQLAEDAGRLKFFARTGVHWVDPISPGGGIFLIEKLRDGELGKIGIAHKLRPIKKRSPERLDREMHGLRRPAFHVREIVSLENVERLDEHGSTGRRRRCADHLISAISPAHRLALLDLIVSQIVGGDQTATLLDGSSQLAGEFPVVEVIGTAGDPLQRVRQVGLAENLSRLVVIAVHAETRDVIPGISPDRNRGNRRPLPK